MGPGVSNKKFNFYLCHLWILVPRTLAKLYVFDCSDYPSNLLISRRNNKKPALEPFCPSWNKRNTGGESCAAVYRACDRVLSSVL